MKLEELLTPAELSEYLNMHTRTLMRWRNAAKGPAWIETGGRVLYRKEDIKKWLDENRISPDGKE